MKRTFDEKFKSLRNAKGLTQDQLSEKLDISRATIANYETGRRIPQMKELKKMSEFFGVTLDYWNIASSDDVSDILARARNIFESKEVSDDEKEKLFIELSRLYFKMTE